MYNSKIYIMLHMLEKGKYDGHPLYESLREKRINVRKFCDDNDISYQTILCYLHGTRNPSLHMLYKILSTEPGKDVDPGELFTWHWQKYRQKMQNK